MKFLVILFLISLISHGFSKPLTTDDSREEFNSSELAEMKKYMQCAFMTIGAKADEVEDFQNYIKNVNVTAQDIMSKVGTDQFDMVEYKGLCNQAFDKTDKFLLSMRNEFATCADDDFMKIVDLVLDFVKEFGSFQCNLSEKELSYFDPEYSEDWKKCADEAKPKVSKCVVEKESNSVGSNESSIKDSLCKINLAATGECIKNTISECGEEQSRGLNLMIDFMLKFLEKKLECPVEGLNENTI